MLELCEPLESLVDVSAEVYGYSGVREVLTFITEGGQPPALMGINMDDDAFLPRQVHQDDEDQHMAPEDEVQGHDIDPHALCQQMLDVTFLLTE